MHADALAARVTFPPVSIRHPRGGAFELAPRLAEIGQIRNVEHVRISAAAAVGARKYYTRGHESPRQIPIPTPFFSGTALHSIALRSSARCPAGKATNTCHCFRPSQCISDRSGCSGGSASRAWMSSRRPKRWKIDFDTRNRKRIKRNLSAAMAEARSRLVALLTRTSPGSMQPQVARPSLSARATVSCVWALSASHQEGSSPLGKLTCLCVRMPPP